MKRLLPFAAALALLAGSVPAARAIHSRQDNIYPVNTAPDADGGAYTVRVFDSITSVAVIDAKNHSRRRRVPPGGYSYDRGTTRLSFSAPLPFAEPVIHVKGAATQPEQFRLHEFDGPPEELLVLLGGRAAIAGYEYAYDRASRTVTFRSDLHPERDGAFYIGYRTADGGNHGFGSWGKEEGDRLAELQWQWMHQTQGAPLLVMKDRSGTERRVTVMRWYDGAGLMAECRARPFEASGPAEEEAALQLGKRSVTRRRMGGVQADGAGGERPVPLVVYEWSEGGAFYRITTEPERAQAAEALLSGGK